MIVIVQKTKLNNQPTTQRAISLSSIGHRRNYYMGELGIGPPSI